MLSNYWSKYHVQLTFGGKKYETSSKLNKVPPIGAPNATATPAAHAALRISRRLAVEYRESTFTTKENWSTLIVFVFRWYATDNVTNTTGDMNKRSFLSKGEARGHWKSQTNGLGEKSSTAQVAMYYET